MVKRRDQKPFMIILKGSSSLQLLASSPEKQGRSVNSRTGAESLQTKLRLTFSGFLAEKKKPLKKRGHLTV